MEFLHEGSAFRNLLQGFLFERGPMPFISIFTFIVAVVVVIARRPKSTRTYLSTLAICLLPLFAGILGYYMSIHSASSGFKEYLAGNPNLSPELIETAKEGLAIGKKAAWDPFILGLILSVPLVVLNTAIFLLRRAKERTTA